MEKTISIAIFSLALLSGCATYHSATGFASKEGPVPVAEKTEYPSPPEIVAKAAADEWVAIAPSDLLVMELAPDAKGKPRRVVIQLMPAPFSQGWVGNIRKLAAAKFWDGTSINRVQDNYVVQWGDATEKKALPEGLAVVPESEYSTGFAWEPQIRTSHGDLFYRWMPYVTLESLPAAKPAKKEHELRQTDYARQTGFSSGWPVAGDFPKPPNGPNDSAKPPRSKDLQNRLWPTHCYGMVGVGRDLSPNTGTGAELYTVIGHAPRHLDRNIALVGRVIEGIEHLSSLPRGTGPLGFYENEAERVPILSIRQGDSVSDLPTYEYLSTESTSFAQYADARANRRDPFFIKPAGGADICNIPVPVRRKAQ
jgi:cyclophilin family peptidyl-prolyl cis-trans isomerase